VIAAIVGYDHTMELALMGWRFSGLEAKELVLVSNLLENEIFSYCGSKDCWLIGLVFNFIGWV
jgi:enoyl-CoA hydratase/carnithine racemase